MTEFSIPGSSGPAPRGQTEDRADGVDRDWLGRYILPQLDGTEGPVSAQGTRYGMTRVSTIKSTGVSKDGVQRWRERLILEAAGKSDASIAQLLMSTSIPDDDARKQALTNLAEELFVKGGGKDRANLGTNIHTVTEKIKRGETVTPDDIEPEHRSSIDAYLQLLEEHNIRPVEGMQERIVKCLYGSAGTFDDMVSWWNPDTEEWELCIADLKTGRDLSFGWLEILMQLWLYANAEAIWTPADGDTPGFYSPMPTDLRRDRALIFHLPMNGTATLYVLDLSGVEQLVYSAVQLRRGNKEAKHKVHQVGGTDLRPEPFIVADGSGGGPQPVPMIVDHQDPAHVGGHRQANILATGKPGEPPTGSPVPAPSQAAADGTPLAPLADKAAGERGCGVCGRKGHKRGSAKCLGAADPGAEPSAEQEAPVLQFCPHQGQQDGWVPNPNVPGQWVHGRPDCMLPSEEAEQQRLSVPAATVDPLVTVRADLAFATQADAVLNLRQRAIDAGTWTPELEQFSKDRYFELAQNVPS